jgi:lipopolysaccharide export system permease protein
VRLLTRYLLRECVPPFLFALGALTGLMLLNQIARQFGDLVGKGLSWGVIGQVFGLSVPFIVAMTLPMAVLVAVLYAFTRLGADNEITAFKASGINLVRLVRPILLAGLGVSAVNFAFNDQVLPRSNHRLRVLLVDIARKKPTFELKEQMVNAVLPGQYYLRAGRIDQASDRLREVVIYDLTNSARRRTIYADSGFMRFNRDRTDLHLTLFDGYIHDYDQAQPAVFRRIFFRTDYVRLRGVDNRFQQTGNDAFRGDREMSVCEMQRTVRETEGTLAGADAQLTAVRENDIRTLLGVVTRMVAPPRAGAPPPARFGFSVAPYCRALDALGRWFTPTPAQADTLRGGRPAPATAATAADIRGTRVREQREVFLANRRATQARLSRYKVEIHKKLAIPAMCITLVLIGAPLALRFPRGGVGLVIGASAGIYGIYYVGLIGGESLADKLIITPFWAMWTPNLVMMVVGLGLFLRLGREHATGRGGEWADRLATAVDWWRARRRSGR